MHEREEETYVVDANHSLVHAVADFCTCKKEKKKERGARAKRKKEIQPDVWLEDEREREEKNRAARF